MHRVFLYRFPLIESVVSLNPQKDHNVCIPSCFIMKETRLPIQYTKNINGTASLVDAIGKIQEKHMYNTPGLYRIQFATFLCKVVDKNKRKKLMNNHRLKQDSKAMEPPKKEIFLEINYQLSCSLTENENHFKH